MKHPGGMLTAWRSFTGRSIGSGLIEGAQKNLIGRRLKQPEPAKKSTESIA
jgi:hypothetical protein